MNFNDFKNKISQLKTTELGGLNAQFKLAPKIRLKYDADKITANNPRKAAVLALFYPNLKNETCFLLTQRASYKGIHSAQISFPGGKKDIEDENLEKTALRETFEEVGVTEASIEIIRELTDVYIPPSNFLATPFLGYANQQPNFNLNYEVEQTIEVLLRDLLSETNLTAIKMNTSYMEDVEVPCFKLDSYIVWGATAMMLSEIKELFK
ncbi:CoA pyrophosphatase [Polaribacter sp. HaHaR_3_91]|uniref:NUDIX hydrolase n=1 Tax=Polaribacter sp. HaHaR_3_91 TaxID=2745561 RepID=UPI001C4E2F8A|nr:CoA pyrophosphatase [Polaribacter sp. HaHaR_3_91]QXP62525.1 CoA pyrophosphatase [Polaribacter sp. HaHaR_3_91]